MGSCASTTHFGICIRPNQLDTMTGKLFTYTILYASDPNIIRELILTFKAVVTGILLMIIVTSDGLWCSGGLLKPSTFALFPSWRQVDLQWILHHYRELLLL